MDTNGRKNGWIWDKIPDKWGGVWNKLSEASASYGYLHSKSGAVRHSSTSAALDPTATKKKVTYSPAGSHGDTKRKLNSEVETQRNISFSTYKNRFLNWKHNFLICLWTVYRCLQTRLDSRRMHRNNFPICISAFSKRLERPRTTKTKSINRYTFSYTAIDFWRRCDCTCILLHARTLASWITGSPAASAEGPTCATEISDYRLRTTIINSYS